MPNSNVLIGGGFHHTAIRVVDFDAAVVFYKKLGFTEKVAWGESDARGILLDAGDGNYVEVFAGGKPETPSEGRIIHFAIRTPDCDAAHALALSAGAVETMAPKDVTIENPSRPVPIRISFVRAPGGEIIEFFQNELT